MDPDAGSGIRKACIRRSGFKPRNNGTPAPGVKNPAPVATGPVSNGSLSVTVGKTGRSRGGNISSISSGAVPV